LDGNGVLQAQAVVTELLIPRRYDHLPLDGRTDVVCLLKDVQVAGDYVAVAGIDVGEGKEEVDDQGHRDRDERYVAQKYLVTNSHDRCWVPLPKFNVLRSKSLFEPATLNLELSLGAQRARWDLADTCCVPNTR
jgi:hypothetical protein